jgi:two-component system, NarL family, invasion response regulator UvrY
MTTSPVRVLVIDDHVAVRRGVVELLEGALGNAQFGQAESEAEALQHLNDKQWDAAILDLNLKARGGIDLIRSLKDSQPQIKVLVYTMHSEAHFGVMALRAGADGYLTKDSRPEELAQALKRILSGGRYVGAELAEHLANAVSGRETAQPELVLSEREYQVLQGLASGKSLTEMGENLHLSVKTISTYRSRILEKLQLNNNSELVRYALQHKIIT